ncbi:class I SAM-dependent methyltransferase [uncultured Kriegella sp.]|uniref:class I SAM-dependent methyltransferase n=1 Tax=uncultured Kriegella sp. TaxID=1798910 RepID=UPI0030D8F4BF|tara:strand:+ start:118101 stop:118964 length:864 start_codon:yes stop_codon:yes gene_type:complete
MEKVFEPKHYKTTTREQWQTAAEAWHRWHPTLKSWLGPATDLMLDMAQVKEGQRVLDIAAGAGEQSITAAKRVGPNGYVLATDLAPKILEFALELAQDHGLGNIETKEMDGENLTLPDNSFDTVISRVGLIFFPDQQKALKEMLRVLKPGGFVAAIVYSTVDKNKFFSTPVSIIRRRAQLPPPLAGQPGPFSLGNKGVLDNAFKQAGFINVESKFVDAPVLMETAKDCVRFEYESFAALHQMLGGLSAEEKAAAWQEIEDELSKFETDNGFSGPCELVVGIGQKPFN